MTYSFQMRQHGNVFIAVNRNDWKEGRGLSPEEAIADALRTHSFTAKQTTKGYVVYA